MSTVRWRIGGEVAEPLPRSPGTPPGRVLAGRSHRTLGVGVVLGLLVMSAASVASPALAQSPPPTGASSQDSPRPLNARARYRPERFAGRAGRYYKLVFGVDDLSVRLVESGDLVRFTWRVLDPEKARVLSDKRLEPALVDPGAGVSLVVPAMEKIGKLRQDAPPEAGKSYWMTFSNKGQKVKRGDHVSIVIGMFRAEGLVVD